MNVIIAAATGYSDAELAPFLKSAKRYVDAEVILIQLEELPRHITMQRNFIALELLEKNHSRYEKVLLSDSRDVVFQGDPFEFIDGKSMTGLEEITIGASYANTRWLQDIYGKDMARDLAGKRVTCSGVVGGSVKRVKEYLGAMCHEIDQCPSRYQMSPNFDQAMHNVVVYTKQPDVDLTSNADGVIATITFEQEGNIGWAKDGIYVQGVKPAILHQYDRWPRIKRRFQTEYSQ